MVCSLEELLPALFISRARLAKLTKKLAKSAADALKFLEKSYQARESAMTHLKVEPLIDSLRSEPRFQELLRRTF